MQNKTKTIIFSIAGISILAAILLLRKKSSSAPVSNPLSTTNNPALCAYNSRLNINKFACTGFLTCAQAAAQAAKFTQRQVCVVANQTRQDCIFSKRGK